MASALSEALKEAAELHKRMLKAYEPIYAALGYSELPPEHVVDAVVKGVEDAAMGLGFRARKAIEEKRASSIPEEDRCVLCGQPLGEADENGIRECSECFARFDRSGAEQRQ
jgi:hypothetical protein